MTAYSEDAAVAAANSWKDRMYARQREQEALFHAYHECCCCEYVARNKKPSRPLPKKSAVRDESTASSRKSNELVAPGIVLLTGASGTGKSRLALELKKHMSSTDEECGVFCQGKFDLLERPESSYAIVHAMTEYVEQLWSRYQQHLADNSSVGGDKATLLFYQSRFRAMQSLADTESLLVNMIPAMRRFQTATTTTTTTTATGLDVQKRLALAVCKFFRTMASVKMPIVLLLDDIQWAKAAPLEIVICLAKQLRDCPGFMLLATCRSNQVSTSAPLSVMLRELEQSVEKVPDDGDDGDDDGILSIDCTTIKEIPLSNWSQTDVNHILRDAVTSFDCGDMWNESQVKELSQQIWAQAGGNVLFTMLLVRQVLRDIQENQNRPLKDTHLEQYKNIVDIFKYQIAHLPGNVQHALKIASCFGAEFDATLMAHLVDYDINEALQVAHREDLVVPLQSDRDIGLQVGLAQQQCWRFQHDQVQQACYSFISPASRDATHLDLGLRLWNVMTDDQLKKDGFCIVRQLAKGAHLVTKEDERRRLADLFHQAGIHATTQSAFPEASSHFELAIQLLGNCPWRNAYALSLSVFNRAASVACSTGDYERVEALTTQVITYAQVHVDKLTAYTTRMAAFVAQNETKKALDCAFHALAGSGFNLPRRVSKWYVLMELLKTQHMLRQLSNEKIMRLPRLTDKELIKVMRIFSLGTHCAMFCEPALAPVMAMRAIRLSLQKGLCGAFTCAAAIFSTLLCNHLGNFYLGHRLAQLSLDLLEQLDDAPEWQGRVLFFVRPYVFVFEEPLKDQIPPLLVAHRQSLAVGDMEVSMLCATIAASMGLSASLPLHPMLEEIRLHLRMMEHYRQTNVIPFLVATFQAALNLANPLPPGVNPVIFTGEAMNEDKFIAEHSANNALAVAYLFCVKLMCACLFRDYKLGADLSLMIDNATIRFFATHDQVKLYLHAGVCYAALARLPGAGKIRQSTMLKETLKKMRKLVRYPRDCFLAEVLVLQAELAALRGKTNAAVSKYERAIELARREKKYNVVGLASERASNFLEDQSDWSVAQQFLLQAVKAYHDWGAVALVHRLYPRLSETHKEDFRRIYALDDNSVNSQGTRLTAGSSSSKSSRCSK